MKLLGTTAVLASALLCVSTAAAVKNREATQEIAEIPVDLQSSGVVAINEETQDSASEEGSVTRYIAVANDDDDISDDHGPQQEEFEGLGEDVDEEEDGLNETNNFGEPQGRSELMSEGHDGEDEEEEEDDEENGRNKQQVGGFWSSPSDLKDDVPEKVIDEAEDESKNKKMSGYEEHDKEKDVKQKEEKEETDEDKDVHSMHTLSQSSHTGEEDEEEENTLIRAASAPPPAGTSTAAGSSGASVSASSANAGPSSQVAKAASGSLAHSTSASATRSGGTSTAASDALVVSHLLSPATLLTLTGALVWFLA